MYSLLDGSLMWSEHSLMNREVRFTIQDQQHRFDGLKTVLHVARGARAQVTIHRSRGPVLTFATTESGRQCRWNREYWKDCATPHGVTC